MRKITVIAVMMIMMGEFIGDTSDVSPMTKRLSKNDIGDYVSLGCLGI